ncbi:hypothetical protein HDE_03336 [Halotydeus destructor]|nr:hypothetical protein HDE_03336 [Halotydeus destructor]
MRSYHYLKCFDVIENLARSQDLKDILNSADFNELCSKTLRSLKFSDKNAGITVLGCLVRLEVSPKVTLVSAALQVIRNELNSLDVDDIIFLDYLLKLMTGKESKTSGVPLADALKIALPIVLELKIGNKDVDFNDPTEMCKCLRMAAFKRIRADKINMLMNALHRLQGQLTTDHCYWISVSLKARYIARAPIDHDLAKTLFDYCVREVAKKDVFRDHEDNEDL